MRKDSALLTPMQWTVLAILLSIFVIVTELLARQEQQRQNLISLRQVSVAVGQLRARMEAEVNSPLHLSAGLVAYIQASNGQVPPVVFRTLLPNLVKQGRHIRNIGIAPDNRITYIHPLEGNEKALGVYYPDLTNQWPQIEAIIARREAALAGPVQLTQGGEGLIHRIPVFLDDGSYWGIVSTVLDIDSIWQLLLQQAKDEDIRVSIRQYRGDHWGEVLVGESNLFSSDALLQELSIAGVQWQLAAAPAHSAEHLLWPIRLGGFAFSTLILFFVAAVLRANQKSAETAEALRESEAYYRTVIFHVADALVVLDPQCRIDKINPAAQRMFGYDSDELNGLSCEVLFPSGQPLTTKDGGSEVQVMNKNGQLLTVELVQSHLDLGHRSMLLLLLRDITVRRQNEQMKDEFVSTVSHELRTPLTAISGALGLLAAGTLGRLESKQQQMLDIALQSSQHLNTLINDLLDIEKLVAGKMELFCKPMALQPLLLQAMQRHLPLATQKGIQIDALWPMPFNEQVNVDSNRLQQVLANLFVNAIRFSPAGTSVQVKAEIIATRVRVSICDAGPGVPIEFEGRLFQKFSQADSSDSRAVGGTGLGLAICKQLIEHMHGYIGYLPNEPQGACFYFELPLA